MFYRSSRDFSVVFERKHCSRNCLALFSPPAVPLNTISFHSVYKDKTFVVPRKCAALEMTLPDHSSRNPSRHLSSGFTLTGHKNDQRFGHYSDSDNSL